MTHPTARVVRNRPELRGKKMLGCGQFGAIFEGSQPDTIMKLTVDPTSYWLVNDRAVGCQGQHFPKTLYSYEEVGTVTIHANLRAGRPRQVPIYLFEQERLERLQMKTEQRALASKIMKRAGFVTGRTPVANRRNRSVDNAKHILSQLSEDLELPESIRHATSELSRFCDYFDDLFLDMHYGNFMVRPATGDLVFSDPVGCNSIWSGHRNYDVSY